MDYVATTRATVAAVWADVLGTELPGGDQNFFALGGDSITCIRVIARGGTSGIALSLRDMLEHEDLDDLVARIAQRGVVGNRGSDEHR